MVTGNPQASQAVSPMGRPHPSRVSLFRTIIFLAIFTAVLLLFIAWLGDWRRRHNVDTLMRTQLQEYAARTADGGLLPLNLQPSLSLDPASRLIDSWLTPDEVQTLRKADHEVMVAWTIPLVRALGPNERAVIYFQRGVFELRWVPLKEFDVRYAQQVTETKRL